MHQFGVASYLASLVVAATVMQWRLTAAVVETSAEKQAWPACKLQGKLCMHAQ